MAPCTSLPVPSPTTLSETSEDRRKAAGAQSESAGAHIVLNSDAQIDLNQIVELALEDAESRDLLEKLLVRLDQANSRYRRKVTKIHPAGVPE